jgi:Inner membrane protein YgaP-like, transmembrane domain
MKMEHYIRLIAGVFILISVGLGWFVHRYWFFFTIFVGVNLIQSSFTKWCLMEDILAMLGIAEKETSDKQPLETKE